jgi:hypothetical protein
MSRIYLAARYSRREELCGYRAELEALGHTVTSRWLNGSHQISDLGVPLGDDGEALFEGDANTERAARLRQHFATEDISDVTNAQIVMSFTEVPRSGQSRGGRHVEFGVALALDKVLIVVGPRENVFHWLPEVEQHDTWAAALKALQDGTP